jgi:putative transferase (TIGR04331 family)
MVFLENFDAITAAYKDKIRKYDALRYIVCEAWIGDTRMSLFLALAREFGIKHICNEHNCFFHPYAGSYIEHAVRLSDKFTTLGWCDDKHPNSIQAGSLFLFDIKGDRTKTIPLLYISAPANIYMVHYSSAYGVDGCNAPQHMNFCKSFFTHLSRKALNQMHYRAYPKPDGWLCYEKESYLSEYLCQVRTLSDLSESAKIQMTQSRLVVIDYVATTYIESLVMNIPTVIFCDPEIYYLKDSYSNFFRPLFDAGICHSNPVEAARFVDGILDQPEQWWFSEKVQNGRNSFLQANLGSGEVLIDYLYSLTNEVH